MRYNHFGQAIGEALEGFYEGEFPNISTLEGQTVRIEKLNLRHEEDLYKVYGPASPTQHWTYLSIEPFHNRDDFHQYLTDRMASTDPYYLTIIDKASNRAVGTFALMRIDTQN